MQEKEIYVLGTDNSGIDGLRGGNNSRYNGYTEDQVKDKVYNHANAVTILYTKGQHGKTPLFSLIGTTDKNGNKVEAGMIDTFMEYNERIAGQTLPSLKQNETKAEIEDISNYINPENINMIKAKEMSEEKKIVKPEEPIKISIKSGIINQVRIDSKENEKTKSNNVTRNVMKQDKSIKSEQITTSTKTTTGKNTTSAKPEKTTKTNEIARNVMKQDKSIKPEPITISAETITGKNIKFAKPEKTKKTTVNPVPNNKQTLNIKNSNSEENKKIAKDYGYNIVGDASNSAKIGYKKGTGNTKTIDIMIPGLDDLTDFLQKFNINDYKSSNDILVVQFNDAEAWKTSDKVIMDIYNAIKDYENKGYKINIYGAEGSEEIVKKLVEYMSNNKKYYA